MKCYNCGTEYEGNYCPNCGVKRSMNVKYPINTLRRHGSGYYVFRAIIGLIVFCAIMSWIGDYRYYQSANSQPTNSDSAIATGPTITPVPTTSPEPTPTNVPVNYIKCDVDTMYKELNDNALRAENKYTDTYVEVTGKLGTIDSDGKYIYLDAFESSWFSTDSILCDITSDDQKKHIMNFNSGDQITIRGKITLVGEKLGYAMDIDEVMVKPPVN